MESPEECKRISVIYSRPSVIYNPSDMLDKSDRYESQFSRDYQGDITYTKSKSHEEPLPNFLQSNKRGYLPDTLYSQPGTFGPSIFEQNNSLNLLPMADQIATDMTSTILNKQNKAPILPSTYHHLKVMTRVIEPTQPQLEAKSKPIPTKLG